MLASLRDSALALTVSSSSLRESMVSRDSLISAQIFLESSSKFSAVPSVLA